MADARTDFLPESRRIALRQSYYLHLATVTLLAIVALIAAAALLLAPIYLFLAGNIKTKEGQLAAVTSALSTVNANSAAEQLSMLAREASLIALLPQAPSATKIMTTILEVSRPGVLITDLSYKPKAGKAPATLFLSGTAITRDALRAFQQALQNTPIVNTVELPVSAYAKDADITFTMNLTLSP